MTSWRRALLGAMGARSLRQTVLAATIVGSVLSVVNLSSSVLNGRFTWVLAGRIALTFLVPWLNATMGVAIGLRHPRALPGHISPRAKSTIEDAFHMRPERQSDER